MHDHAVVEVPSHRASEDCSFDVSADPLELVEAVSVRNALDVLLDDRPGIMIGALTLSMKSPDRICM